MPGRGKAIFVFSTTSRQVLGFIQPPAPWVPGALSPGVKLPRSKTDYSPLSTAKVKNVWSYTFTSAISPWCGA